MEKVKSTDDMIRWKLTEIRRNQNQNLKSKVIKLQMSQKKIESCEQKKLAKLEKLKSEKKEKRIQKEERI